MTLGNVPSGSYGKGIACTGQQLIKLQAASFKQQASSLTAGPGDDRMNLERNNYGHNTIEKNSGRSGGDPETSKTGYGKV